MVNFRTGSAYTSHLPANNIQPHDSHDFKEFTDGISYPPHKKEPERDDRNRRFKYPHKTNDSFGRREPLGGEESLPFPSNGKKYYKGRPDTPASVASSVARSRRSRTESNGAFNPYVDQRYGPRDMYDPSYYYYMQNYQKYFDHPFYREYYRQFFGRYGYPSGEPPVDDKASTRSGRSSVNEELKKSSLSSQFTHDFVDQSSVSAYESSFYPEQYSYNGRSFASNDVSRVPSVTDEPTLETPHRMSPHLYTGPHLRASFTSGGKLLLVLPNDPKEGEKATVQLRNVQKMLAADSAFDIRIKKLAVYPGPLTIKETHKDVVLRFCEEQAIQALKNDSLFDKDSVVLMWNYLLLLVKQNGNVCGADLASLLLRGKNIRSDTPAAGELGAGEEMRSGLDLHEGVKEEPKVGGQMGSITSINETELVKKFTELLCLGRKKEAVDYAIREKLWGYAMILAAKMDSMTHARVMAAFMQTIPSTDVLQTLMQHLSGKKPEVTRNYSAERWGDWRLHLAAMVSNPTGNVQKDHASIISLGDTLASKHRYYAAHLCYLAAEAEWDTYSNKDSKLVLLGSSPNQPFQMFASDDAIQCTEIYEFAKSLDANNPLFFRFQSYKLIYGYRLAEFGFPNEALRYCQVITEAILRQPTLFHVDFVDKLLELASQLKYHDVHYQLGEGEVYDMADPEWLQYLNHTLQTLQYKAKEELTQTSAAEAVGKEEPEAYAAPESDGKITSRRNSDLRTVSRSSEYVSHAHQEAFDRPTEHHSYKENSIQPDYVRRESYYDNGASSHLDSKEVVDGCSSQSYRGMHSIPTAEPQPEFGDGRNAPSYSSSGEHYTQQLPSEIDSPVAHASISSEPSNQQIPWQPEYSGNNQYQIPDSNQMYHSEPIHQLPQQYSNERPPDISPHEQYDNTVHTAKMSAEEEEYWKMMTGKVAPLKTICALCERKSLIRTNLRTIALNNINNLNITMVNSSDQVEATYFPPVTSCIRSSIMPLLGNKYVGPKFSSVTARKSFENDFEKGMTKNNLVFGGSFPIDAPISARPLGVTPCKKSSKTFQIDEPCCAPPHICEDHRNIQARSTTASVVSHQSSSRGLIDSSNKQLLVVRNPQLTVRRNNVEDGLLTYPVDDTMCDDASCTSDGCDDEEDDDDDAENLAYDYDENYDCDDGTESYQYECERHYEETDKNSGKDSHDFRPVSKDYPNLRTKEVISQSFYHSNIVFCPQLQTVQEQSSSSRTKLTEPDDQHVRESSGQTVTTSQSTEVKEKKECKEAEKSSDDSAANSIQKEDSKPANEKNELNDDKKSSGFLGSLFGGWRKGNNQAKLPDDKNPTIVWDETKKKWVNKDGDDNDNVTPPPPPSTFAGQPPPTLRGVIKKSRYVDPVGDRGKTKTAIQSNLSPLPMMGSMPAPKIANSVMPTDGIREAQQFGESSETALPGVSPVYDNQSMIRRERYASSSSSVELYDEPGFNSLQGTNTSNEIPMMNPVEPQQQPLFFNPAQFQVPQGVPPKPAKRTGPAKRSYNPQR